MPPFLRGLVLLCIVITCFTSCKKGENDPVISFRSRKARVTGNWHVKSGKQVTTNKSTSYESTTESGYGEDVYRTNTTLYSSFPAQSSTGFSTGNFKYYFDFKATGDVTLTKTIDKETVTTTGKWNFTGKIGDLKNKEQIMISVRSSSSSLSSGNQLTYGGSKQTLVFNIRELRNKKMVIYSESSLSSGSGLSSVQEEYELAQ